MRACINGSWQDLDSTEGINALIFGVVPDSGPTPGDLVGVTSTLANAGPCKVYMGSAANRIRWTGCTVYSNGRKQVIAAQTSDVTTTTTASNFQHLCISAAGSAPALTTTSATETANLPTFTANSPALCLATIKENGGGTALSAIYDTRVFTTSTKHFATIATTAAAPGWLVTTTSTIGQYTPAGTTAGTGKLAGVVVATNGATATTTINAIIVTAGPIYIKATTPTGGTNAINDYLQNNGGTGSTTGYASTIGTAPTNIYSNIGIAQSNVTTTCGTLADNCRGSIFTILSIN